MGEISVNTKLSEGIQNAIAHLERCETASEVKVGEVSSAGVIVTARWRVDLPTKYEARGETERGIRSDEIVEWLFPLDYPLAAPQPTLRSDFPLSLPHINPVVDGRVSPCIAEVNLTDLLHSSGIEAVFLAMTHWLNNAASGELLCPIQGWEPIRRDNASGLISADTYTLKEELKVYTPVRFYRYRYAIDVDKDMMLGHIDTPSLGSDNNLYKSKFTYVSKYTGIRHGPVLLFQAKAVVDEYWPEYVRTVGDLRGLLQKLGLGDAFDARIKRVMATSSPAACKDKMPIEEFLVIVAVRRPFHLIGTASPWELLPYRICFSGGEESGLHDETKVYAPQMMMNTCPAMLRAVSGADGRESTPVAFIGCGSLGSKMALHLAKTGCYEFALIDKDIFSSHNNARYGKIVRGLDSIGGAKATLVAEDIKALGVYVEPIKEDALKLGQSKPSIVGKKYRYIVDTTASLPVRYFLAHQSAPNALVMHSVLFGKASMGVLAVEGDSRAVRVDDLMAFANSLCISDERVKAAMYGNSVTRESFGDGCSSATTKMDDIGLSLLSAAIAGKIHQYIGDSELVDSEGALHLGHVDSSYQLTWEKHVLSETLVIPKDSQCEWEIRVLGNVRELIETESNGSNVEQGGILAGMVCALSNTVYVTHVVPAPPSSQKTPTSLLISTEGIPQVFDAIHSATNSQITFLGTWHSHPLPSPPSATDKSTHAKLTQHYDLPVVMLVYSGGRIVRV